MVLAGPSRLPGRSREHALFLYYAVLFPPYPPDIEAQNSQALVTGVHHCPHRFLVSYNFYGYISMATLSCISQWLAQYGQFVAGMSYTQSIKLLSIYTCGSLLPGTYYRPAGREKQFAFTTLLMFYTFISLLRF